MCIRDRPQPTFNQLDIYYTHAFDRQPARRSRRGWISEVGNSGQTMILRYFVSPLMQRPLQQMRRRSSGCSHRCGRKTPDTTAPPTQKASGMYTASTNPSSLRAISTRPGGKRFDCLVVVAVDAQFCPVQKCGQWRLWQNCHRMYRPIIARTHNVRHLRRASVGRS